MMYCKKCKTENEDDASFCANCGSPLEKKKVQHTNNNRKMYIIIGCLIVAIILALAALIAVNKKDEDDMDLIVMGNESTQEEIKKIEEQQSEGISEDTQEIEKAENESEVEIFVASSHMQEYKDIIYTVYDVYDTSGLNQIPQSTGYFDDMAVYKDKIYWCPSKGTGENQVDLIQMDLDGSNQIILSNCKNSWSSFFIYEDYLYYEYLVQYEKEGVWNSTSECHRIDLKTLKDEECGSYIITDATEELWILQLADDWDHIYYCEPGFKNIKLFPYISRSQYVDICGDMIYYTEEENFEQELWVYSLETGERELLLEEYTYMNYIANDVLYSTENGKLIRKDLRNGSIQKYNLKGIEMTNMYIIEINGMAYFDTFTDAFDTQKVTDTVPPNTLLWELDMTTGEIEEVGRWYES